MILLKSIKNVLMILSLKRKDLSKQDVLLEWEDYKKSSDLAKKAAESSKMSSGNDILMEHVDDTLQKKQPSSAIAAEKTTDEVHT